MRDYYLFLDESKPNNQVEHFCLGGCIIEKNNYINNVIPFVQSIKNEVFNNSDVVLHETEIRKANGLYRCMRNVQTRTLFWTRMKELFDNYNFTVLSTVVTPKECKRLYNEEAVNDEYFIALQIILENYVHFLNRNNGKGSIFIESRNPTEDKRLQNHYFNLISNGTLFLHRNALQKHVTTISFPLKQDNNIGLQIADFIPNVLKKYAHNLRQRTPSIKESIVKSLYDGGVNNERRFGLKIIP